MSERLVAPSLAAAPVAAAPLALTAGLFQGDAHLYPVRVYYEDTDAGGIVYHANYLRFAERARTEMLRAAGVPHAQQVAQTGAAFAVRHCAVDFLRPARLEDALVVVTRITSLTGATVGAEQIIRRLPEGAAPDQAEEGEVLVRVTLKLACITSDGRPTRVPAAARAALERWRDQGRDQGGDRTDSFNTANRPPAGGSVNRRQAGGEQE